LLLILIPVLAFASEVKGKYTKEKKISKSYSVNSNVWLGVTNKYGNVYVTTWDQNTAALDIVITVSGNDEDKVTKRLNSINVDINAAKDKVSATTSIGNFNSNNVSMEINYTIKIPKQGAVNINNQYGGIMLGKIYGESYLVCKYGDIKIDELNNRKNLIDMEYCGTSNIGFIDNAKIVAKYSNINLNKAEFIGMDSDYTNITINDIDEITFNSNYGNINIITGEKVFGVGKYLQTKISSLTEKLNLTVNYGSINILSIDNDVKSIAINTTYSPTKLAYSTNYPFDFEMKLNYSNLQGGQGLNFQAKDEKNTRKYYKGYNISSGKNSMIITSDYGDIKLIKR
jgi:hypothetical protein